MVYKNEYLYIYISTMLFLKEPIREKDQMKQGTQYI